MVYQPVASVHVRSRVYPIETMRGLAVLALVSYHVIGSTPGSGLELGYPHPLRFFADGLVDLRMPFFAFVAGFVFGVKPVTPGGYADFLRGKWRRLAIPGALAALIFALASSIMGTGFARGLPDLWQVFFLPYAHFWFLQSILLIFVFAGGILALTGGRYLPALFGASVLLFLFAPYVPGNPFSVNGAIYLLPFFLLGLIFERHQHSLMIETPLIVGLALPVALTCLAWNVWHYETAGHLSLQRQDVQSLMMGLALSVLAIQLLPHLPQLGILGPYAFTIYLYHVLATAGAREVLYGLGLTATAPVFLSCLAAGIIAPVLLHLGLQHSPLGRRWMLGLKG